MNDLIQQAHDLVDKWYESGGAKDLGRIIPGVDLPSARDDMHQGVDTVLVEPSLSTALERVLSGEEGNKPRVCLVPKFGNPEEIAPYFDQLWGQSFWDRFCLKPVNRRDYRFPSGDTKWSVPQAWRAVLTGEAVTRVFSTTRSGRYTLDEFGSFRDGLPEGMESMSVASYFAMMKDRALEGHGGVPIDRDNEVLVARHVGLVTGPDDQAYCLRTELETPVLGAKVLTTRMDELNERVLFDGQLRARVQVPFADVTLNKF